MPLARQIPPLFLWSAICIQLHLHGAQKGHTLSTSQPQKRAAWSLFWKPRFQLKYCLCGGGDDEELAWGSLGSGGLSRNWGDGSGPAIHWQRGEEMLRKSRLVYVITSWEVPSEPLFTFWGHEVVENGRWDKRTKSGISIDAYIWFYRLWKASQVV